jgi:heme exporter protein D
MNEVFAMGDYGAYVWTSYGLTLIVLIVCVVQGKQRHKSVLANVRNRIRALESET